MANTSVISGTSMRAPRNRPRFSLISLFTNQGQGDGTTPKRPKPKKKLKREDTLSTASQSHTAIEEQSSSNTVTIRVNENGVKIRECPLCYDELELDSFPELSTCDHRSCSSCLENYLGIEVGESRVDVTCPECPERLHPTDIHKLLKCQKTIDKYEEFMVRKVLVTHPDTRWCPAPDCGYAVIAHGCAPCPMLKCGRPGCNTLFCYHCKQEWHADQTCDAARFERLPFTQLSFSESLSHTEEYKQCPRCKTMINKMNDGSCNHMTCSICGTRFCWLCLKEASDLHYLSPSGCTFWGKKPWSRKKKILWQLGTLIGAPVGIALLAGLSVPILIFGLPIWAGRKLYQKFKKDKKHKRNAIVAFGTIAAFIASPIIAGVAIAVGVPITLTYVYGVVPISLCRGGTCGVKSTTGTFSFDFSNSTQQQVSGENGDNVQSTLADSSSLAAVSRFSASLSQIDHEVDQLLDHGSDIGNPSMRNLAGGTSISGSFYNEDNTQHKRVEILAEVNNASGARQNPSIDDSSISQGDNASLAADERSVKSNTDNRSHVSFQVDNASTRALAGSRCGKDIDVISTNGGTLAVDASDSRSVRSRVRGDHGSPVSNRSVSFANVDEAKHLSRSSKYSRSSRKDRASLKSMDGVSNGTTGDAPDSKSAADVGNGSYGNVGLSDQTLAKVEVNNDPVNPSGDHSR